MSSAHHPGWDRVAVHVNPWGQLEAHDEVPHEALLQLPAAAVIGRGHGDDLVGRNPKPPRRMPGPFLPRKAERQNLAPTFQLPPRKTRPGAPASSLAEPSVGAPR